MYDNLNTFDCFNHFDSFNAEHDNLNDCYNYNSFEDNKDIMNATMSSIMGGLSTSFALIEELIFTETNSITSGVKNSAPDSKLFRMLIDKYQYKISLPYLRSSVIIATACICITGYHVMKDDFNPSEA